MEEMIPFSILHLPATDSTNLHLKRLMQSGEAKHGLLIRSDFQTGGRGYAGNGWESEAGKNLLFSFYVEFNHFPAEQQFLLSQGISLSICRTLSAYSAGFKVKWPNDVYYHQKKIGGILIENQISGALLKSSLIGVGINILQEKFISTAPNPISLKQILIYNPDIELIFNDLLQNFSDCFGKLEAGNHEQIREEYLQKLYRINEWHPMRIDKRIETLSITGVNAYGMLQLRDKSGKLLEAGFKEVAFMD